MKTKQLIFAILFFNFQIVFAGGGLGQFRQIGKLSSSSTMVDIFNEFSYPIGADKNTQIKNLDVARYRFKVEYSSYNYSKVNISIPIEFYTKEGLLNGIKIYNANHFNSDLLNVFIDKFLGGNKTFQFLNKKIVDADKSINFKAKSEKIDDQTKRNKYFDKENKILLIIDYDKENGDIKSTQIIFTDDKLKMLSEDRIYPFEYKDDITILKGTKYKFKLAVPNLDYNHEVSTAEREYYSKESEYYYVRVDASKNIDCPVYCPNGATDIWWFFKGTNFLNKGDELEFLEYEERDIPNGKIFECHPIAKRADGSKDDSYYVIAVLTKGDYKFKEKIWVEAKIIFKKDLKKKETIVTNFFDSIEFK